MATTEKILTLSNMKYIIGLMQAHFMAPFARKLAPGARINGIPFDGSADVEVAPTPMKNVELFAGKSVSVLFSNNDNARMVMTGTGLYFYDGTNLTNLLTVSKNSDGTYKISDNVNGGSVTTGSAAASAKQAIGFQVSDDD